MSVEDDFKSIVARLRGWGFKVTEWSGCYGRNNGTSWANGKPVGHGNHHYVCSLNPAQSYINSLVQNLADGQTVNWFADANGNAYLIGTGPMNHFGTGNSSVLSRTQVDQPNYSVAGGAGDMSGNQTYSGTECQHPGDSTPWPQVMLEMMFAINAAEFLQWGYKAARGINHYAWTNRKIDMSWMGGPSSGDKQGKALEQNIQRYMDGGGTPPPEQDWFDMATKEDLEAVINERLSYYLPRMLNVMVNGQGNAAFPGVSGDTPACTTMIGTGGVARQTVDVQKNETYGSKSFYSDIVETNQLAHQIRAAQ